MIYYLDTSALVKYSIEEIGSDLVAEIIQNPETYLFISEIACIEIKSSLHTKLRTHQVKKDQLTVALLAFNESLTNFYLQPFNSSIRARAEYLIETYASTHALRSLDAIQLATFLELTYADVQFVCADDKLLKLTADLGYSTLNPNKT